MPKEAIPIIGAVALAIVAPYLIPVLGVIGTALVIGAASYALSVAFAPKPFNLGSGLSGRTATLRQPVVERTLPFGEVIVGGALTFYESTVEGGKKNNRHHLVIVLGDAPAAPWAGIPLVWLDNTPVFESEIDAAGEVVSGKFAGKVRIRKHLGGPDQAADEVLEMAVDYLDASFRGRGVAYLYIGVLWDQELFPNGLPQVRALARTNTVLDPRDDVRRYTANAALALHEYLTLPRDRLGRGYDPDVDLAPAHSDAAANVCDEVADALSVGHAVIAVDTGTAELTLAVAGSGAPLRIETGDRVELATAGTLPGVPAAGTDYYAIVDRLVGAPWEDSQETAIPLDAADYTGEAAAAIAAGRVDAAHGPGIRAAVKLASSLANAYAGTSLNLTNAGTGQHVLVKTGEPRYAVSGVLETGSSPRDLIEDLLSAMAGDLAWAGDRYRLFAGAWRPPDLALDTPGDLVGPIVNQTRHSRRERFNAVKGLFATHLTVGEVTDYPPVIDSAFVAADGGGPPVFADRDKPFTSRAATAQRLAKIDLSRHRRELSVTVDTTVKALAVVPGDTVALDNDRRGWTGKTFEVRELRDIELRGEEGDLSVPAVRLVLRELDATAFDFDPASEETVKPPKALPPGGDPFAVPPAPDSLTFSSGSDELTVAPDGTVVERMRVLWSPAADAFVDRYDVEWRRIDQTEFSVTTVPARSALEHLIHGVSAGETWVVRVRARNLLAGTPGPYLEQSHTVIGKDEPPPPVTTFNVTRLADGTRRFEWTIDDAPPDVRVGGGVRLRYFLGSTADWDAMTPLQSGLLTASPWETNVLAAGTYTFAARTVDSSDNENDDILFIQAVLGDPRLRDVLYGQIEHDIGWPGTLTDAFVAPENAVEAKGTQTWDDLPGTWDALADSWAEIVASASPISYETEVIDLGVDVFFTPLVTAAVTGGSATIEMRSHTAAQGSDLSAEPYVALAGVSARYLQIRVTVTGAAPVISSLVILLDGEVRIDDIEDLNTFSGSFSWFERTAAGHFKVGIRKEVGAITSASITALQSVGAGWSWELLSKSATIAGHPNPAAEFKVYNGAGSLADATVDITLKGPKAA